MTYIKAGTRVTATLSHGSEEVVGVLLEKGQDFELPGQRSVQPDEWAEVGGYHFVKPETIKEVRRLAFVGPKPEPVKEPTFAFEGDDVVFPFEVCNREIVDANGQFLARVDGDTTDMDQDRELANLIVELLNKHFGAA